MRRPRSVAAALAVLPCLIAAAMLFTALTAASFPLRESSRAQHSKAVHHAQVVHAAHLRHARAVRRAHRHLLGLWTRVAVCEEGGWRGSSGYKFPDSLGITRDNWFGSGGRYDVRPWTQVLVAQRLIHSLGMGVPDQSGCAAW